MRKWVDYTDKYGLGYRLSNNATGVIFNDQSKICLDPNGFFFGYFEFRNQEEIHSEYTMADYPKEL